MFASSSGRSPTLHTVHNLPSSQELTILDNYPITSVHRSGKAGQKIILIPGGMGLGRGGVGGGGEDIPKIEWVKSEKLVGMILGMMDPRRA